MAALRDAVFVKGEAEDAVVRLEEEGLLQTARGCRVRQAACEG